MQFHTPQEKFENNKGVIRIHTKRTDNANTTLHRKIKIRQHEPHYEPEVISGAPESRQFLVHKWHLSCFVCWNSGERTQALVSFKKYMPSPLPYFKVNICPFPLPYFASIFFAYLWSFRGPDYIVTLPRYFSFRLPHLNISTGPPSDELDKNIQRTSLRLLFSHWNGYSHLKLESGIQIPCENDKVRIEPA
jgi:hypothetical protein